MKTKDITTEKQKREGLMSFKITAEDVSEALAIAKMQRDEALEKVEKLEEQLKQKLDGKHKTRTLSDILTILDNIKTSNTSDWVKFYITWEYFRDISELRFVGISFNTDFFNARVDFFNADTKQKQDASFKELGENIRKLRHEIEKAKVLKRIKVLCYKKGLHIEIDTRNCDGTCTYDIKVKKRKQDKHGIDGSNYDMELYDLKKLKEIVSNYSNTCLECYYCSYNNLCQSNETEFRGLWRDDIKEGCKHYTSRKQGEQHGL